jgi:hypothetical protein
MNNLQEITSYPICDCDIWVKLSLGGVLPRLFQKYDKIIIADFVENEILKWDKNSKFYDPAKELKNYKDKGKVIIIKHDEHIPEEDRMLLELRFGEFGLQYSFKGNKNNKGEIASAIYAEYFEIPLLKTDDGKFISEIKEKHFKKLKVMNLNETLRFLIPNDKERIKIMKQIEEISKRMSEENKKYKLSRKKIDSSAMKETAATFELLGNELSIENMIENLSKKINSKRI